MQMTKPCQAFLWGVVVVVLLGSTSADKEVKLAPSPIEEFPSISCAKSQAAVLEGVATIVCLNGQVTQQRPGANGGTKSINLGKFTKMTGNVAQYSNGDPCESQPGEKMSSTVTIQCGAQPSVGDVVVGENGCQFSITMVSPSACDPSQLKPESPSPSPPPKALSPPPAASPPPPKPLPKKVTLSPPPPKEVEELPAPPPPTPKKKEVLPATPRKTSKPELPPTEPESPPTEAELPAPSSKGADAVSPDSAVPASDETPSKTSEANPSDNPTAISARSTGNGPKDAKGIRPEEEEPKKKKLTKDNAVVAAIVIGPMFVITTILCWGALYCTRRVKEQKAAQEHNSLTDPFSTIDNPLRLARAVGAPAIDAPPLPTAKSTGGSNWV